MQLNKCQLTMHKFSFRSLANTEQNKREHLRGIRCQRHTLKTTASKKAQHLEQKHTHIPKSKISSAFAP